MPGTLAELLPSAFALLGVPGCGDTLGLAERIGDAARIAVVLVDGLGWHLLARAAQHAPFLADVHAGRVGSMDELAAPFPSTTPTSLVTLGTGATPGEHGVLGFTVNVPGTDRVLTHIVWRDDPPPATWAPVPTLFERARAAGVASTAVGPAAFAGSGLTVAAYRGATYAGHAPDEGIAARVRHELNSAPLVYAYTAAVDTAAHLHGIASPQWGQAVAAAGALLERIVAGLPADAALLVTADHGGFDAPATGRFDVGRDPVLADGVRVVAGEPRVRYLHTRTGAAADVAVAWRAVLADRAEVLLREDAITRGLFGPVAPAHLPRIGDVVVICTGDTVVLASGHEPPQVAELIGFHGALTPAETAIPLICVRGSA